jgi:hypothetical protein
MIQTLIQKPLLRVKPWNTSLERPASGPTMPRRGLQSVPEATQFPPTIPSAGNELRPSRISISMSIPRHLLPWICLAIMGMPTFFLTAIAVNQRLPWWHVPVIIVGIMLLALLLVRVCLLIAGWDRLARRLPGSPMTLPQQPAWNPMLVSIALGKPWMMLNNCVRWASDTRGLTLAIERPFNLATPAIVIAWDEAAAHPVPGYAELMELIPTSGTPLPTRLFVPRELLCAHVS